MTPTEDSESQIRRVADRLADELTSRGVPPSAVEAEVRRVTAELTADARVTQYVPILVHRAARDRLLHPSAD
jgi:hypothetical protein